jgi:hypothetical protein
MFLKPYRLPSSGLITSFLFAILVIPSTTALARHSNTQKDLSLPFLLKHPGIMISQTNVLGTKQGLVELRALLDASKPTEAPGIRKIVIQVPKNLPEASRYSVDAALQGITEFFLIIATGKNLAPERNPRTEGLSGELENGGTINLIASPKEKPEDTSLARIIITNHRVPGYEKVQEIILINE